MSNKPASSSVDELLKVTQQFLNDKDEFIRTLLNEKVTFLNGVDDCTRAYANDIAQLCSVFNQLTQTHLDGHNILVDKFNEDIAAITGHPVPKADKPSVEIEFVEDENGQFVQKE